MNVSKKYLFGFIFGFVVCFGLITCHDVSAIENYTLTFDSNSTWNTNTLVDISNYNYITVTATGSFPATNLSTPQKRKIFSYTNGAFTTEYLYPNYIQTKIVHCSDVPNYNSCDKMAIITTAFSSIPDNESVSIVLSENPILGGDPPSGSLSISANGTYNVSNYASVDVNVPTGEDSRFMGIVIDSFWQYHVAFASACVGIIVIFLVYRIIKGRLR